MLLSDMTTKNILIIQDDIRTDSFMYCASKLGIMTQAQKMIEEWHMKKKQFSFLFF